MAVTITWGDRPADSPAFRAGLGWGRSTTAWNNTLQHLVELEPYNRATLCGKSIVGEPGEYVTGTLCDACFLIAREADPEFRLEHDGDASSLRGSVRPTTAPEAPQAPPERPQSRYDTVITFQAVNSDGEVISTQVVRREDVTTTNGAYRCVRDTVADWSRDILHDTLARYRQGEEIR